MTMLSGDDRAASRFNRSAQSLSALHARVPTPQLVRNLQSQVGLLRAGDWAMPVTVDSGRADATAAWVCSPLTTYCRYAGEEIDRHLHGALAWPLRLLCRGYGRWLGAAGVDRAVAINNWLLSTNLYPALDTSALQHTIAQARARWPRHALWFRSLNTRQHPDWLAVLAAEGFSLVPSRQVWCFEAADLAKGRHANLKRDLREMQRSALARAGNETIGAAAGREDDYERIAALYGLLYLDKYSRLNPHYTAAFMRHWHRAGLLELHGWRDGQGQLQAVVGLFVQGGIITAPVVGYNTALPAPLGLYRLLMATVFARAIETGYGINLSAGAGHFKRLRGGQAAIEYSAVYAAHLALPLRAGIGLLRSLATHVGVPVMQRFQL
ncbi:hypothetical protein [Cupriavidus basilensis]|uniref:hypothetical protein n=1 Tax=Cupriavidus basilensis TaxID=68895 RepID=UPI0039F6B2C4